MPYLGVFLRCLRAWNKAFSAPKIWSVLEGYLAKPIKEPAAADELGADQLADQDGEVGGEHHHAVLQLGGEVLALVEHVVDAAAQLLHLLHVLLTHVHAHADVRGFLHLLQQLFAAQNLQQLLLVCVEFVHDGEPGFDFQDHFHQNLNVGHDFDDLGEVPAEPLFEAHGLVVHFPVDFLEQVDGLDDHGVHLVAGELEFEAGGSVGQAERHGAHVALREVSQLVGNVFTQQAEQVVVLALSLAVEAHLLGDLLREVGVLHLDRVLDISGNYVFFDELLQGFGCFPLRKFEQRLERVFRALELLEAVQLHHGGHFVEVVQFLFNFFNLFQFLFVTTKNSKSGLGFEQNNI
eukprot:CAMPEP_0116924700 /NCGR_PEP_ID=MMETSP0467-20121206/23674_1 /TAXON_ID=283647 /ORGANISM="Mesodinium pulex, Strain SPMC105" /LENGTH=348 /DNA_ID=CAMNT_0004603593 /DNA_START=384 /DNA_END=1427 /DNA_ORIENTATION=+